MPLFGTGGGTKGAMVQTGCQYKRYSLLILGTFIALAIFSDDYDIVFYMNGNIESMSVDSIDSITFPQKDSSMLVALCNRKTKMFILVDSVKFEEETGDTIRLLFQDDKVHIVNPQADIVDVITRGADVEIVSCASKPMVILAEGHCDDGRIIIDNDESCTLILSNLQLTSRKGSAIYLKQKQKAVIEMPERTHSILGDAATYSVDSTDTSNGCLYNRGNIVFTGKGTLTVTGNHRHGISSGKNISVESGDIIINDVVKNGINCDKFTIKDGCVSLILNQNASKGIKTKEKMEILGGRIEGEAYGDVTITDGDVSYCTLIKSDGVMNVDGGIIELKNQGQGGRCISVDGNMTVTSGILSLECNGDGNNYINGEGEIDYYTSKCITGNRVICLERGQIHLLTTGNGAKGIDCSDSLFVGRITDDFISSDSLLIDVETKGTALVDDFWEDYRRGCPKAIKADNDIHIYSGTLHLRTHGQGGEGIECKKSIRTYNTTIIANCFDDGINTGERLQINGSHIFCHSINNDGIDSNGKFTINDGIIAAISEHYANESFDTENGRLYIYGGTVIGIGNGDVEIGQQTSIPYYSTSKTYGEWGSFHGDGIDIEANNYLTVSDGEHAILSFYHEAAFMDAFITVASTVMQKGCEYYLIDGEPPSNTHAIWLDGLVIIGGFSCEQKPFFQFQTN